MLWKNENKYKKSKTNLIKKKWYSLQNYCVYYDSLDCFIQYRTKGCETVTHKCESHKLWGILEINNGKAQSLATCSLLILQLLTRHKCCTGLPKVGSNVCCVGRSAAAEQVSKSRAAIIRRPLPSLDGRCTSWKICSWVSTYFWSFINLLPFRCLWVGVYFLSALCCCIWLLWLK